MMYRNSFIKVDGFRSPQDFEAWVDEKSVYINSLLEKKDSKRLKLVSEARGSRYLYEKTLNIHQT